MVSVVVCGIVIVIKTVSGQSIVIVIVVVEGEGLRSSAVLELSIVKPEEVVGAATRCCA